MHAKDEAALKRHFRLLNRFIKNQIKVGAWEKTCGTLLTAAIPCSFWRRSPPGISPTEGAQKKYEDWLPGSEKGRATAFFSSMWTVAPVIFPSSRASPSTPAATGASASSSWSSPPAGHLAFPPVRRGQAGDPAGQGRLRRDEYNAITARRVEETKEGSAPHIGMKVVLEPFHREIAQWPRERTPAPTKWKDHAFSAKRGQCRF